ncbi:hypothetical protein ALNOE001_08760 [Candidatus Methanobinarius endosymbioticus]|uniref:Zinc-ribbon domain-containing protein n=1 Tax=Candidatus Methanobinarius endosymbioticus TaxID=2006182 RepID=A0A366MBA6_9EURY|nr:hypothetical protein ALNOE001_08760 [Candidatus Methanobinarius endosymbioticus]
MPRCGKKIKESSDFCYNCGLKSTLKLKVLMKDGLLKMKQQSTQQFENDLNQQQYQNNVNQDQHGNNYQQVNLVYRNEKNAGLAAVLSFLIIDLGQIYNREIAKGLILLSVFYLCIALFLFIIPPILALILWVYAIYDAYTTTKKINEGIQ